MAQPIQRSLTPPAPKAPVPPPRPRRIVRTLLATVVLPILLGLAIVLVLAITPWGNERVRQLVVSMPDANGNEQVIRLAREKSYSPVEDPSPGAWRSIARRIVVHFAMGQAF